MSYHGQLSREAEEWAIAILRKHFGLTAHVIDRSLENDYDFEVDYGDGRFAVGEIGLLADSDYEAAWAALTSREFHHQFNLPPGLGTWGTHLYDKPNIKAFENVIGSIIEELVAAGLSEFNVGMHHTLRHVDRKCEEVGIKHLQRHLEMTGDRVVYFLDMGQTFFIDNTLSSLVASVERAYLGDDFKDSWQKLQCVEAQERHLFFKCGSLIDLNHQLVLLTNPHDLDIPDITFPPGITDIWVAPGYLEAKILGWSISGQKQMIDPPDWRI